jgi:ribosomal protein S8
MKIHSSIFDLCARLKKNSQNYKKSVIVKKTKPVVSFLNLLYKEGFIEKFFILDTNQVMIYLRYQNYSSLINEFQFFSRTHKEIFCKLPILLKYKAKNSFYILYTNKGFISLDEACVLKIGGQLICKVT